MKFQLYIVVGLVALSPCNAVVDCAYKSANYPKGDYGDKIHGLELKIADLPGCSPSPCKAIDMTSAVELKKMFPKCDWKGNAANVASDHKWKLPKCTGCSLLGKISGQECDSCGYADICEQMCAKSGNCGQVYYKDGEKSCQPLKVTRTCTANPSQRAHLQVGIESKGNDLKTSVMGADKLLQASALSAYFPQCPWSADKIKDKHWELKDCNKCGPNKDQACTQCELAEICGMMCSQSSQCKHFTFHGSHCHPKDATGSLHAKATHISGKPIKMCYTWTQKGVDQAKTDKKEAEYGQPAVNKHVSSKVEATFTTSGFMKTALMNGLVKRVTCPEDMVTGHAASLQPLWIALAAISWVGMQ